MKRLFLVLSTAIVILPWLAGARAQADAIQWTASGSPLGPNFNSSGGGALIYSNNGVDGAISLLPGTATSGTNSGSVVASQVGYGVNPDASGVPTFGGPSANYSLSLALHDDASGASGSLTFRGNLSGEIGQGPPDLTNTFLGSTTQTLKLGQNLYTVTIGPYVNGTGVSPFNDGSNGSISASIAVQPAAAANATPEPSSLVLACLGLPSLGLARCFRCQRRRKDVDCNTSKA